MNDTPAADFVITRVIDAPVEMVWRASTEPEQLMQWWGPEHFKMTVASIDLQSGGMFHYGLEAPAGFKMWGRFVYREVSAPNRLVFVVSFSDEQGNITRHPMVPTWPLEVLNIITLTEENGKTLLTLSGGPINATEEETTMYISAYEGMRQGFKGTYDQLDAYLAGIPQPR
jgi:uncharacterized protein YndB with AHSA1/START domain